MSELLDSMTTTGLIALFAVVATVVAAAVGAGGAIAGIWISERGAEKRHRERIEREDRHRFLNERRRAYAYFVNRCIQIIVATVNPQVPNALIQEANVYYHEIVFMARREIAQAASDVWEIVTKLSADPEAFGTLKVRFNERLKHFEDLARADVSLDAVERQDD